MKDLKGTKTERNLQEAFAGGIHGPEQIYILRIEGTQGRL